jgi:MFS family permease
MKAIRKLKITWRIAIFSLIISFFLIIAKKNISWGVAFAILSILFVLSRRTLFKNKHVDYRDYYMNYTNVSFYYFYGTIFLIFAILFSLGSMSDLINKSSIPLLGTMIVSFLWIFGILITYYTYQAEKEFHSTSKSKMKPKKKIERESIRKFNIGYFMAFVILATIIGFVFGLIPVTLVYVLISFISIILLYFFLRIILSKMK